MMWIKVERGLDPDMDKYMIWGDIDREFHSEAEVSEFYKEHILQLIKTPKPYVYIVNKMIRMFGTVDYWFENCFGNKLAIYNYPYRLLYFFNWFQYIYIVAFACFGCFISKEDKLKMSILSIFIIGHILAHVFIEAFAAYRLCIYPLLLIYAVKGFDNISSIKLLKPRKLLNYPEIS